MDDKNKNENAEVDLRDYLKLISSKKRLVLGIFLAAIIMAVIYNYSTPKIYEVNTWLEIGKTKENILIENPVQITQKMKIGIYGEYPYNVIILNPGQTDLIQIKIESAEPEKAKKDIEKISALILADHEEKIKIRREGLKNEIKNLETKVDLLKQMGTVETIIEIKDAYSSIISLRNFLTDIQPTEIIKSATISSQPVKPKSFLNIVIAGLFGIFLGVFLVFWKKWGEGFKN